MRKLLFILISFLPLGLLAQSGTTMDEYRYLTKGLAYQKEMGLDAQKEGYILQNLIQTPHHISFVGLYRLGKTTPQAIVAIFGENTLNPEYICIPNNLASQSILNTYEEDKTSVLNTTSKRNAFEEGLRHLAFTIAGTPPNSDYAAAREKREYASEAPKMTSKGVRVKPAYSTQGATNKTTSQEGSQPKSYNHTQAISIEKDFSNLKTKKGDSSNSPIEINANVQTQISGALQNRSVVRPVIVAQQHPTKGVVAIKVCVDSFGDVHSAKFTQKGSTTFNNELKKIAINSTEQIKFQKSDQPDQCGVVTYYFQ